MTVRRLYQAWVGELPPAFEGWLHAKINSGVTWRVQSAVNARPIMFVAIGQEKNK